MTTLVIYVSAYGNTEQVALAVAESLRADARRVADVDPADPHGCELLIVGSRAQGGKPLPSVMAFLSGPPDRALEGKRGAAFDSRTRNLALRLLMRVIGYAAPRITAALRQRGGILAIDPEGFVVEAKEGRSAGEEERATRWARQLAPFPHERTDAVHTVPVAADPCSGRSEPTVEQTRLGTRRTSRLPLKDLEASERDALQAEGYGVLTEVDVAATPREEIGTEMQPYRILGACNPHFGHEALRV